MIYEVFLKCEQCIFATFSKLSLTSVHVSGVISVQLLIVDFFRRILTQKDDLESEQKSAMFCETDFVIMEVKAQCVQWC